MRFGDRQTDKQMDSIDAQRRFLLSRAAP